ncbi:GNAT family N-acetyltransferase [Mycobacterium sp. CBMA293]|uniref:GNAT family N-acetyltransferase n=2 Tax=Mycolicibacterium TaxID=1866885 RepID=UPI0012DC259D|nr:MULTISPECIES: GNAT family N-acetyltransferase [unclassified Mycolicibacterium]MUL49240.1 GNAT family N-acetyltransferase [Mycolicibacterium sp. CBMA 360]MUL60726.1 GNAT family N-acetyltransferase [Mycolicibacterium sp. CBMA 335]MUL71739.1 GNAT family N-acetyltransferase [Mycolicibacterium sp. CBMA 311]MUL95667.1 GNAT family N-acetyltransferase [Mycolicibacterium sp. CBMA 230]MUM03591.1 GNAT family N-acetyltransferase [Mycolicibacterium sp. CBMA 213]
MHDVATRPATRSDIGALSQTLARAFADDPMMRWMIPNDRIRRRGLPRLFASLTRHTHLAHGGVEIAPSETGIGAAALWDPPGKWRQSWVDELRMAPTMILAMGASALRGQAASELMKKHHPEEPHWYLAVIGSDPTVRGGGYGQALMRSRLDRCDAEHAPAYLESSNPANVPYYERFGFEVTGEMTLPYGGPPLIPMWRQPR